MSRNFELLHEAGRVQEMLRQRMEAPAASPAVMIPGTPAVHVDGMAREELSKLVQRLFLAGGSRSRQVVFAGTERGNGNTWICAHTADVLASQLAGSVCVVDCDVLFPTLHQEFHVSNNYGLAEALLGGEPIRQHVQQLSRPNLWLLSSGGMNETSQALLTTETMRRRMGELRAEFDYVLLDVAPANTSNHGAVLAGWCDGLTLVLKANSSNRKAARQILNDLQVANTPVLGAVLNERTFPVPEKIYARL